MGRVSGKVVEWIETRGRVKWSWFFGQSEGSIKVYSDGEIITSESG